jgi:large subunit ribosomal protein L29
MNIKEFKQLNLNELQEKLVHLKQEAMHLRMKKVIHQLRETHKLRDMRRNIARVYTFLSEKLK